MRICKILSVVGARPNFMKIAPFVQAIKNHNHQIEMLSYENQAIGNRQQAWPLSLEPLSLSLKPETNSVFVEHILVHTGQHYDMRMSETFFTSLRIPDPDINLEVGSGSHAEQVGHTMIEFEKVLKEHKPDWVVVVGDVNATLACSVTAKKEGIGVCHIEAGLRSNDLSMPEEINRLVTDRLSDLLLTPDRISSENLLKEGVPDEKIRFVGNIMIDTLESNREKAGLLDLAQLIRSNTLSGDPGNLLTTDVKCTVDHYASIEGHFSPSDQFPAEGQYIAMTLHRPSNVDKQEVLEPIVRFLTDEVAREYTVIWPIHPRTQKQLRIFGMWEQVASHPNMFLLEPLGYHEMLRLTMGARLMLTDSGGLQEECCVLGIPCLTLRWNTERPVTLMEHGGASVLVGNDIGLIRDAYQKNIISKSAPARPPLWDGHTAERCLAEILRATQKS